MTVPRSVAPPSASLAAVALLCLPLVLAACGGTKQEAPPAAVTPAPAPSAPDQAVNEPPAAQTDLPDEVRRRLDRPFKGDLDEMVKRRAIRLGVTFNRTFYFVDKGVQRGVAYEYGRLFEDELNKKLKTGNLKVHVLMVPLPRDQLASALLDGRVDFVAAQVAITPEREKLVDFLDPSRTNVSEVVVTGPGAPPIAAVEDLAGQEVHVRKGSTYAESLVALNQRLAAQGKPAIVIKETPQNLEDDDLLEMANAGLIQITIADDYLAKFWKQVFTSITVHQDVAVRTDLRIAAAIRKNSPQLRAEANAFLVKYGLGTAFGNVIAQRYLQNTKFVKSAASDADRRRFRALIELFRKYSNQYSMDFLLMAAQGFQESGLNQNAKSVVGAIGVMQIMPATGAELRVGDIRQTAANIHGGVKYMRFMMDQYFKDEPMDGLNKGLFTFASYNAGPGRIRQLRQEAAKRGLNPNVWFGNVEQIASERIGRETVTYVSNIYKYYIAYRLVYEEMQRREALKAGMKTPAAR